MIKRIRKYKVWYFHVIVLLLYLLLCIGLTWPLIKNFTTAITGVEDANQLLWLLWHTKLALKGQEPFFSTSLLYYPYGATLITIPLYPIVGLFALPFWTLGAEAAYNGTLLISFVLTGYFMYLLARSLGFDYFVSFFAGTMLIVAPIHLISIIGHLTKAFIGFLPLALLVLLDALDIRRNKWWSVITAFVLLLVLLASAEQFVFAGIAVCFFVLYAFLSIDKKLYKDLFWRISLIIFTTLILISWFIPMVIEASTNETAPVNVSQQSYQHQPDLIQFFIPTSFHRALGPYFTEFHQRYEIYPSETAVYLFWTGIILSLIGLIKGDSQAKLWVTFTLFCILFALGPDLKIIGNHYFQLPFALFAYLPGLQSMRASGRIMLIGFVGIGISASFGLAWIRQQLPDNSKLLITVIVIGFVLFESWPQQPWRQTTLRPVPEFYYQISYDRDEYGVFDLPFRPNRDISYYSSYYIYSYNYQWYQMNHGKGIASGYIGRPYSRHPLFGQFLSNSVNESPFFSQIFVNGKPANRYANALYELARNNYRYVVFHKPQDSYIDYKKGSWGELAAKGFIENVLGDQKPLVDDYLVTVYEVGTITDTAKLITTTIAPIESTDDNWVEFKLEEHWMRSPALFYLASPSPKVATLEINISEIIDKCSQSNLKKAKISIKLGDVSSTKNITVGKTKRLPITLDPGSQILTLSLNSWQFPKNDSSCFTFKIDSINLNTFD